VTVAQRIRSWIDCIAALPAKPSPVRQAGAVPYAVDDGNAVFLLITSRRSGRWIFPKGAQTGKREPWRTAAREAYEEAGVEGEIGTVSIGSYRTLKRSIPPVLIDVDMYPLRVTQQLEDWPERGERRRQWASLRDAKRLLSDPQLVAFAVELDRRLRDGLPAAIHVGA
jgi:8-oxo-dGTP pyrophosphatase MutT (NUDIX family)